MKKQEFVKNLVQKNEPELKKDLEDSYKALQDLRFNLASKKIKNYKEIKEVKKKIARISTLLNEKEALQQAQDKGEKSA